MGPTRQTHIMYRANLTWNELKKDLDWLKSLDLIEKTTMRQGIFYKITSTGVATLSHFDEIQAALQLNYENETPAYQHSRSYVR